MCQKLKRHIWRHMKFLIEKWTNEKFELSTKILNKWKMTSSLTSSLCLLYRRVQVLWFFVIKTSKKSSSHIVAPKWEVFEILITIFCNESFIRRHHVNRSFLGLFDDVKSMILVYVTKIILTSQRTSQMMLPLIDWKINYFFKHSKISFFQKF